MIRVLIGVVLVLSLLIFFTHRPVPPKVNLIKDPAVMRNWTWEQHGSSGGITIDNTNAIRCDILQDNGDPRSLVLSQVTGLESGHHYRLKFSAKADKSRPLEVICSHGPTAEPSGLQSRVLVGEVWHDYTYPFAAEGFSGRDFCGMPMFHLGGGTGAGTIWLKDIVVEDEN